METEERSFSDESRFDHVRLKDARAMDVESKKIDLFKNIFKNKPKRRGNKQRNRRVRRKNQKLNKKKVEKNYNLSLE